MLSFFIYFSWSQGSCWDGGCYCQHRSERSLQLGLLYSADEALRLGLVDVVVKETDVIETARHELINWKSVPSGYSISLN